MEIPYSESSYVIYTCSCEIIPELDLLKISVLGTRTGNIYLKLPVNKKVIEYEREYEKIDEQENIWKFNVEIENEAQIKINLS